MLVRWGDDGGGALSFTGFPSANNFLASDDVVLFGGQIDPGSLGYDTVTPIACISEIDLLLYNGTGADLSQLIEVELYPWTGIFGQGAFPPPIASLSGTVTFGAGLNLLTVDFRDADGNPLPVPKAFWVRVRAENAPTTFGWIIGNGSLPMNR